MHAALKLGMFAVAGILLLTAFTVSGLASGSAGLNPLGGKGGGGGGGGGCPNSNAIGNFNQSSVVGVSVSKGANTWSYYFSSLQNLNPTNGVPGLISYCVYPNNGTLPNSISVSATGADGSSFTTVSQSSGGYFAYQRNTGDPSNIPLDGTTGILMGSATWTSGAPSPQTILLHINDATECQAIYGGTGNTCFVYPGGSLTPPCEGMPVCKTASIAEATSTNPLTVPVNTVLHITWTFTIVNQLSNNFNMEFPLSTFPASNPNTTGLRDSFDCGASPDPSGSPGAFGNFPNYQSTGFDLYINHSNLPCNAVRLILTNSGSTLVLTPGQSITFTVNMVDSGFSAKGMQCLNWGINLRWVQSDDGLLHAFHAPDVDVLVA